MVIVYPEVVVLSYDLKLAYLVDRGTLALNIVGLILKVFIRTSFMTKLGCPFNYILSIHRYVNNLEGLLSE